MSAHLSEDERVAAADGSLDAARQRHVDACVECRRAVDQVRSFLQQLTDVEVPEPSPLFWDLFARRISAATTSHSGPGPAAAWRAWLALTATAAAVFATVWLVRHPASVRVSPAGQVATVETTQAPDANEVDLETVMAMTVGWSDEDWFVMTDHDAVSFEDLSSDERATFVRLLSQQMDVMQ